MPFAFFNKGRDLRFRHSFSLEVLQKCESTNLQSPIGYSITANAVMMTHGFVKIAAGPERLEIRRYENADEGINLNRIQEHCVGRMLRLLYGDRWTCGEGTLLRTFADDDPGSSSAEPSIPTGFGDDRRLIPLFNVRFPK